MALVGLCSLEVMRELGPLHKPKQVLESDHRAYLEMARFPLGRNQVPAPFCWRVLAPEAARALTRTGLDLDLGFWLLTNLSLVGFLMASFALLRKAGADPGEAALGTALLGLMPGAVRWYQYQYWMTDPPALLLVTLGLLAVQSGREAPLLWLGALGLGTRETYALVFGVHAVATAGRESVESGVARGAARGLLRAALFALPGLAVAWWIRTRLAPRPEESLLATAVEALSFRFRHLFDNQIYFVSVGSFGAILALALASPRELWRELRSRPEWAALLAGAYASLALANNTDRLLAYATPALLLPALRVLRRAAPDPRRWRTLAGASLGVQLLFHVRTPWRIQGVSLYLPSDGVVTLACLLLLAVVARESQRHPSGSTASSGALTGSAAGS